MDVRAPGPGRQARHRRRHHAPPTSCTSRSTRSTTSSSSRATCCTASGAGVPAQARRDPRPRDLGLVRADQAGTYDIQCVEMCGIGHALMPARIVIESAADHDAGWPRTRRRSRRRAPHRPPAKYEEQHDMAEPAHDAHRTAHRRTTTTRTRTATSSRRELLREVLLVARPQDDRQAVPVHRHVHGADRRLLRLRVPHEDRVPGHAVPGSAT